MPPKENRTSTVRRGRRPAFDTAAATSIFGPQQGPALTLPPPTTFAQPYGPPQQGGGVDPTIAAILAAQTSGADMGAMFRDMRAARTPGAHAAAMRALPPEAPGSTNPFAPGGAMTRDSQLVQQWKANPEAFSDPSAGMLATGMRPVPNGVVIPDRNLGGGMTQDPFGFTYDPTRDNRKTHRSPQYRPPSNLWM